MATKSSFPETAEDQEAAATTVDAYQRGAAQHFRLLHRSHGDYVARTDEDGRVVENGRCSSVCTSDSHDVYYPQSTASVSGRRRRQPLQIPVGGGNKIPLFPTVGERFSPLQLTSPDFSLTNDRECRVEEELSENSFEQPAAGRRFPCIATKLADSSMQALRSECEVERAVETLALKERERSDSNGRDSGESPSVGEPEDRKEFSGASWRRVDGDSCVRMAESGRTDERDILVASHGQQQKENKNLQQCETIQRRKSQQHGNCQASHADSQKRSMFINRGDHIHGDENWCETTDVSRQHRGVHVKVDHSPERRRGERLQLRSCRREESSDRHSSV